MQQQQVTLPQSPQDVETLMTAIIQPQNQQALMHATNVLKEFQKNAQCVPAFMMQLTSNQNPMMRALAAVLLRRKILTHWATMDPAVKANVKQALWNRLTQETVSVTRTNVAALISQIARTALLTNDWDGLLQGIVQLTTSQNEGHRTVAYQLLQAIVDSGKKKLFANTPQLFGSLLQVFVKGLSDNVQKVGSRATLALASLLDVISSEQEAKSFQQAMPLLVQRLYASIESRDYDAADATFDIFHNCIQRSINILGPMTGDIIKSMMKILNTEQMDDVVKTKAVNILCQFVRFKSGQFSKNNLIAPMIQTCVSMLCTDNSGRETDDRSIQAHGVELLDELILNVPTHLTAQICIQAFETLLKSQNYLHNKGAFLVLSTITEGQIEFLIPLVPQILPAIITGVKNQNPVVRAAASQALMHFSEYLSSEVVKYHASVVPALLGVINMETNVRVMEKQVIGLSLYCGYLEDQIAPYVQHIMTKAGQIYKGAADDVHLKCAAVSLMKAVAQASGAKFEPYAQNSLNLCAQVMEMKQDGILDLRQQATDFVSVLCTAVGPEKFAPYFETFMQLGIMSLQLEYFQLNSSTYTMFGTFAEAYKANLTNLNNRNYTDVIFELCVTTLVSYDGMTIKQRKAAFDDNGNDEDEDIVDSDSDDDDQMVTYHVENGYMDEKKAALLCISCLLQHVGEYLLMKFDTLIKVFPILLEYPHPPVRNICVDTIKDLLEVVYKKYNTTGTEAKKLGHRENLPENVGYMLEHMMPLILSKIIKETCWETMADAMKTLQSIMGWWGFSAIEKYVQHLLPQIHLILSKKHACFEDDYDRDFALDMQVHDYILMDATFDLIGCLAYTCGAAFDPALKEYFPYILQFSDKKRHEQDRAMAIGLISDAFDHGNGDAQRLAPFLPAILPLLSSTLRDESASVRRNATFCCGVMYMRAGPAIAQAIPELLPLLVNLVAPCDTKKDNPTDNKFGISDNALSAIVKMAFTCPQQVPIEQILGKMLVGMPLRNDVMESKYVMAYFVQLFETKPQLMMSQQILPQCVSILAQVLGVQQSGIDMPLMLKLQVVAKGIAQSQQQALQQILQQLPQAHAQNFLSAIQ